MSDKIKRSHHSKMHVLSNDLATKYILWKQKEKAVKKEESYLLSLWRCTHQHSVLSIQAYKISEIEYFNIEFNLQVTISCLPSKVGRNASTSFVIDERKGIHLKGNAKIIHFLRCGLGQQSFLLHVDPHDAAQNLPNWWWEMPQEHKIIRGKYPPKKDKIWVHHGNKWATLNIPLDRE